MIDGPQEVTLYVTDRCNARCEFCKRESEDGVEHSGEMTVETVREILDTFPTLRSCCIAGFGEPLLVKHLDEIVGMLAARGLFVGLITNGIRLLTRVDEMVARWPPLGYLSVSLNATTIEEHDRVFKVPGAWNTVLLAILAAKRGGLPIGISFVVSRLNVDRVPKMIELGEALEVDFVHLLNLLPHGGPAGLSFLGGVIREGSQEEARLLDFRSLPGAERVKVWPAALPQVSPMRCQSPFMSIGVDAAGNVSACRRIDEPKPENGSFRRLDIWTSEYFQRYRDELSGRKPLSPTCAACFGSVIG